MLNFPDAAQWNICRCPHIPYREVFDDNADLFVEFGKKHGFWTNGSFAADFLLKMVKTPDVMLEIIKHHYWAFKHFSEAFVKEHFGIDPVTWRRQVVGVNGLALEICVDTGNYDRETVRND